MLELRLPPQIERRLDALAKRTGRSKASLVREAILDRLDDLEDIHLAEHRLADPGMTVSLEQLMKEDREAACGVR